jgi:hypothetical protein
VYCGYLAASNDLNPVTRNELCVFAVQYYSVLYDVRTVYVYIYTYHTVCSVALDCPGLSVVTTVVAMTVHVAPPQKNRICPLSTKKKNRKNSK